MLYCEPQSLVPIAKTAGQFMEEVTLSSILKESDHHYKESSACQDSVQLPGASCLRISFDSRYLLQTCPHIQCWMILLTQSDYFADYSIKGAQQKKEMF